MAAVRRSGRPLAGGGCKVEEEVNAGGAAAPPRQLVKRAKPPRPVPPATLGRFRVGGKLGSGSFGDVYVGADTHSGTPVAIKLEGLDVRTPQLPYEIRTYQQLQSMPAELGYARMYAHGETGSARYMVMTMLGHSLEHYCKVSRRPHHTLSLKTVLAVADQALHCLQHLHMSIGRLHRDIKPGNLVMGPPGRVANVVHLIDFGLAKPYRDSATYAHIPMCTGKVVVGTLLYMSLNTHRGLEQGRRDDVESLAYVCLHLLKGTLPWDRLDTRLPKTNKRALKAKLAVPVDTLCTGAPALFAKWIRYARGMKFEEQPDYMKLRRWVHEAADEARVRLDTNYDWVRA